MAYSKAFRVSERRRLRNRAVKSRTRHALYKARRLIQEGKLEEAEQAVKEAISLLDRAVTKGVFHRNNADRKKSRLMKQLNALRASLQAQSAPTR